MGESMAFDVLAIDKASEVFKKVGDNAADAGDKMGKIGKLVTTAMAAAVTSVIAGVAIIAKVGISEFKENQSAVAQLNAVLASTHDVAGTSSAQMQKLADTIQNYSGQTHESIEASESLLLGFGNIHDAAGANNDILTQATAITADLAARMGGDASTYAVKLGKALNDPTKGLSALTRMGVQFTAAQTKQIDAMQAAGNVAGAQQLILAALTTRYGGAAKAAGETLPGELNRAKLAFDDVAASIVQKLMPTITSLVGWVTDKLIPLMGQLYDTEGPAVANAFSKIGDILKNDIIPVLVMVGGYIKDHATLFKALAVALGTGAIAIYVVVTAMKAWAAIQAIIDSELLANPIGLVIVALAALAAGLVYAYKHSQTFRDVVQGVMKDVSAAFSGFMDVVKTVFDFITAHWQLLLAVVLGPLGVEIDLIVDHWQTFKDVVTDVWNAVTTVIEDAWKVIKPIFDATAKGIGDVAGAAGKVGGIVGKGAKLLGFDQGGVVPGTTGSPTLAVVHGGEMVLPTDALTNTITPPSLPRGGSGSGGSQVTNVYVDGQLLFQIMQARQQQNLRRGNGVLLPAGVTG